MIGTVEYVQCADGQAGDFSFIALEGDPELSHKIGNASHGYMAISNGTYLSPAAGTHITRYGYRTGFSYGTVTATNVAVLMDNTVTLYGITMANITSGSGSVGGDSGGPFLTNNAFCGVLSGGGNNNVVYFTPYSLISNSSFCAVGEHATADWFDAGENYHAAYCYTCRELIYEEHREYWIETLGYCYRCGRTGPILV